MQGEDEAPLDAACDCIHDLRNWMIKDRLMLNDKKTEQMLIGTRQQLEKVDLNDITVGYSVVEAKSVMRYCRITPLLHELHSLPVKQRSSLKIVLFVFKAIHGIAPT